MRKRPGAEIIRDNTCRFSVWAPLAEEVEVIFRENGEPENLEKSDKGYWEKEISGKGPGTFYKFRINNEEEFPDPASRWQPEGVHSWSGIPENSYKWKDNEWKGLPISEMIIYELHVGTFTAEGTFEAVIGKIEYLKELGVNTLEIMPVSQYPGNRNWGYDGVYPYAAQDSYGGPLGLKKMIDACHQSGIAVLLDAVYNHMGPEGNYLSQFGPYFTDKYQTPWGKALNYDDEYCDEVREFFLQNALMWMEDYHFDGLRLDAIHEIIDRGARHFLKELSEHTDQLEKKTGRSLVLIAESDLNDTRIINSYDKGGYGLEGQWVDDFHHSLHTLLTGEKSGYYQDFGTIGHLAKTYKQGFYYDGVYSQFRKRRVGNSPEGLPASQFVVCIQNHDQVGNRMKGERLTELISFEALKLAAGVMLTSPFTPMLFMGEEFAEDQPFQYFVSHGDPDLVKAVQEGRKREFEYFMDVESEFPDPQSQKTFNNSKLNWNFQDDPQKKVIFNYYRELIRLRKNGNFQAFRGNDFTTEVDEKKKLLIAKTEKDNGLFIAFSFNSETVEFKLPETKKGWKIILASADKKWNGPKDFPKKIQDNDSIKLPPNSLIICESS